MPPSHIMTSLSCSLTLVDLVSLLFLPPLSVGGGPLVARPKSAPTRTKEAVPPPLLSCQGKEKKSSWGVAERLQTKWDEDGQDPAQTCCLTYLYALRPGAPQVGDVSTWQGAKGLPHRVLGQILNPPHPGQRLPHHPETRRFCSRW